MRHFYFTCVKDSLECKCSTSPDKKITSYLVMYYTILVSIVYFVHALWISVFVVNPHIFLPSSPPPLLSTLPQAQGLLAESSWSRTSRAGASMPWSRWRFLTWSDWSRSSTSTMRRRCWQRSTTPSSSDCEFAPQSSLQTQRGRQGQRQSSVSTFNPDTLLCSKVIKASLQTAG